MTLDLTDCGLSGAALTAAFLDDGLAQVLDRYGLLSQPIEPAWDALRRSLRTRSGGSAQMVHRHVTAKLAASLGYGRSLRQDPVITRDGMEDGGWLMQADGGTRLRAWSVSGDLDLDATPNSARAYRCSPTRVAQRVLLATDERVGLLTNGGTLRLLLSDPSRADSHLSIPITGWSEQALPPDSYRLMLALAGTAGLPRLPLVLDAARLHQAKVTIGLRRQAREAITGFINAVLDRMPDRSGLDPGTLWREALVLVYRLLFILKLEASAPAGGGFSFASTRLWRTALSPNLALGALVRRHLDHGAATGRMLEDGLRTVFAIFRDGLSCSELQITPLGGGLFGDVATRLLDRLEWGERAVAILLDRLIWTTNTAGERARVHYGSLDVEELGRVYETLLEQEPGIAAEPMIRRRHGRLETVVPRRAVDGDNGRADPGDDNRADPGDDNRANPGDDSSDRNCSGGGQPEVIETGRFFLHAGQGRKASGSFYTPHAFVRFLVRETLAPKLAELSPPHDPRPAELLRLKIIDPATGSGHFLVEACRVVGEALLIACRLCDERGLHDRIAALPDPDNSIAPYLPSRTTDGGDGFSETRARAICRRLVAVHCLYGCDCTALAVELAKLSLWLESYAEGLPLTFLDHRLIHGDALNGPFFAALSSLPVTGGPLDPLLAQGVAERLRAALCLARRLVADLNASIGRDLADLTVKQAAKDRLDAVLQPLRQLARAWAGAVMTRQRDADDVWLELAGHVAETGTWPHLLTSRQSALLQAGAAAVAWDLDFPEVFPAGFSVVLGNPPWDVVQHNTKDFVAAYDPAVLTAATPAQRASIERAVLARPDAAVAFQAYRDGFERRKRIAARLYQHQRVSVGTGSTAGNLDLFRLFAERGMQLIAADGAIGVLMPSAFHANEGATGIRRLYLRESNLAWCLSFENRRRIFDIDSRFKFDLIVARLPGPTRSLRCAFYLDAIDQVADPSKVLTYTMAFLQASGGASLTPLELRGAADLAIAERLFGHATRLGGWCGTRGIRLGRDLHMTDDVGTFSPADPRRGRVAGSADPDRTSETGRLILHEGKTFHQFTDRWDRLPRYTVARDALRSKPAVAEAARYYRLAFRDIARSNDERTMIACIVPPGIVLGHTASVEKTPWSRRNADALLLCALFNTYSFDWLVRQKAAVHLSLYILESLPIPAVTEAARRFLAHGALRLSCGHPGYAALWREQVGAAQAFQALRDTDARWLVRAQMDALVADAYGLDPARYAHVLGSFTHGAHPAAASLCSAALGQLRAAGTEAFCDRHDPFARVPLIAAHASAADARSPVAPRPPRSRSVLS